MQPERYRSLEKRTSNDHKVFFALNKISFCKFAQIFLRNLENQVYGSMIDAFSKAGVVTGHLHYLSLS